MSLSVTFVPRDNGPERLECEVEIVFEDGPLAGMKLVGFSLWKAPASDDAAEFYVTFPSRAFGAGTDRRYFDYLRAVSPTEGNAQAKVVKTWILEEYKKHLSRKHAPVV
jgi:hypothetical protein